MGRQQAEELAAAWTSAPTHIFHSPYLRTQQTALPTAQRFSNIRALSLPVHEFTNLEPSRWNGTEPSERFAFVEEFWQRCDAAYQDGPGAESFTQFYSRIAESLRTLQELPENSTAYIFSHGFAMNMMRMQIRYPERGAQQIMSTFIDEWLQEPIHNVERMELLWNGAEWRVSSER